MSLPSSYLSQCPSCSAQIDVSIFEPFAKIPCPFCQQSIRVRRKFDHFVIIRQIGEGGMSRVFEAEDETLGRRVALKILHRHYSLDQARMQQFQNEALITARVTHPNVIKLYSVGYDQGYFYIAMELVTGGSLEQRIKRDGIVPEKESLRIGRQVADGLRAAYRMGLQHRDVKPANILFTDEGIAKVVDFGLALFVDHKDESGEIWATPFYVSPEKVIEGNEDFRGDLFSLGATLYHALTGKPPHKANTSAIAELRLIKCRRVTLEDAGTPFAPRTLHIVDRLLAFKPEDRPPSYDATVDELRLAEGLSDHAMVVGGYSRRRMTILASAAALVMAFIIGLVLRSGSNTPAKSVVVTQGVSADDLGGDSVTIRAGEKTIATRFEEARNALRAGKVDVAMPLFEGILKDGVKDHTTLNKTRYNAALCRIIRGDAASKSQALALFNVMGAEHSDGKLLDDFFVKLGTRMGKDLGLSETQTKLDYNEQNEGALGYLAHGLAQWHLGDPKIAASQLGIFLSSRQKGTDLEWIELYHAVVEPYAADVKLVKILAKPDEGLDDAAITALITETQQIIAQLKTQGALRAKLNERLNRLERSQGRLRLAAQWANIKDQLEHQKHEEEQLTELSESLPSLVRGYDYSPAINILRSMKFDSPGVQSAMETKLYLNQSAADFLTTLFRDIQTKGWQGRVLRREIGPVDGRVTAMSLISLTLSLEKGAVTLPMDQVQPETLLNIAQDFCKLISDSDDYFHRQELIAVFARMQGLQAESDTIAKQLIAEYPACRQRWMKVMQDG